MQCILLYLKLGLLDRQSVKTSLLPRIRNVCDRTSLLSVRVNSLICVGKLLDHMEKWQVIDDVLPWLPQVVYYNMQLSLLYYALSTRPDTAGAF